MGDCKHKEWLDSVDVASRPIRWCTSCGYRVICLRCNDTHKMELRGQTVPCTHCPVPCSKCRYQKIGAYCARTPCRCDCHDSKHYGHWNGMCPARKHGLDFEGQRCDLCEAGDPT